MATDPHQVVKWGEIPPAATEPRPFVSPKRSPNASTAATQGQDSQHETFDMYVRTPVGGATRKITVKRSDTVTEIKGYIATEFGIGPEGQQLLVNGHDLDTMAGENGRFPSVSELRLTSDNYITLIPRLNTGAGASNTPPVIPTDDIARAVRQLSVRQLAALVAGREPIVLMARIGNQRVAIQIRLIPDGRPSPQRPQQPGEPSAAESGQDGAAPAPHSFEHQPPCPPRLTAPRVHPLLSEEMASATVSESREEQERLRDAIASIRQRMASNAARRDPLTSVASGRVEKRAAASAPAASGPSSATLRHKPGACASCGKRLRTLLRFKCRCEREFCMAHKHAEDHACTFDYRSHGRQQLADSNPLVCASKIEDI
eukprot:Opistho-1_new@36288